MKACVCLRLPSRSSLHPLSQPPGMQLFLHPLLLLCSSHTELLLCNICIACTTTSSAWEVPHHFIPSTKFLPILQNPTSEFPLLDVFSSSPNIVTPLFVIPWMILGPHHAISLSLFPPISTPLQRGPKGKGYISLILLFLNASYARCVIDINKVLLLFAFG